MGLLLSVTNTDGIRLAQPTVLNLAIRFSTSRRAQCAIIDPNTESNFFLEARPGELEQMHLSLPFKLAYLKISGKDVEDLSFVDLPVTAKCD